jgi:hypothetical protein
MIGAHDLFGALGIGNAKANTLDCFVASLLAMTG